MAERNSGCLFTPMTVLFMLVSAVRDTTRERSYPRPQKLHTAQAAMEVVAELTSEHGGQGAALPYAQRALELDPKHVSANRFMAYFYFSDGKFLEALPYAELVARSRPPTSVYDLMILGQGSKGIGRLEGAVNEFRAALALSPDAPDLWILLGETLSALGQHTEAGDAYARRLDLNDGPSSVSNYANDPKTALAYGRELSRAGRKEDALDIWQAVANLEVVSLSMKQEAERLLSLVKEG